MQFFLSRMTIAAALSQAALVLISCSNPPKADTDTERLKRLFGRSVEVREMAFSAPRPHSVVAAWTAGDPSDPEGYALRVRGQARSGSFRALVVVDKHFTIKSTEVETYQGDRGGGIRRSSFERQFRGKTPDSPLQLGEDIDAVTGATLSSRSLTDTVRQSIRWLSAHSQSAGTEK